MSHTLWCGEVDDVSVALEHVDLLNGLDGLDIELLEGLLELLVIGGGPLWCPLHLPARGTLSSDTGGSTELLEALLDVGHLCEAMCMRKRRVRGEICGRVRGLEMEIREVRLTVCSLVSARAVAKN